MSPTDKDSYFSYPDFFTPKYDEVHISVTFTWDMKKAYDLKYQWKTVCNKVKIGGPVFQLKNLEFIPGMYLKKGITITSRGCPFNCDFCLVPKREGRLQEINIKEGNIIQDNNILACSKQHINKVFQMLKKQRAIEFKGGLDKRLLKDWHIEEFRSLRIKSLWFACDNKNSIKELAKISSKLKQAGFNRNKLYCYVLIGKDKIEEENRLKEVFNLGFLPFAQLYRNEADNIIYSRDWRQFQRKWSRPAAIKSIMNQTDPK